MPPNATINLDMDVPTFTISNNNKENDILINTHKEKSYLQFLTTTATPIITNEEKEKQQQQQQQQEKNEEENGKTVSFAPIPQIKEIDHINDMKQTQDINHIWYSRNEYRAIMFMCQELALRMECGLYNDNDENEEDCSRGLERHTTEGRQQKKINAFRAVHTVLQEQDHQRMVDVYNIDYIANKYAETCHRSLLDAQERAIQDHKVIVDLEWKERNVPKLISELAFVM